MENIEKLVYVPMAVDVIHPGHLNIIRVASQLGKVMVGLFTDQAIASYKRAPYMNYEQRKEIIKNIKGVDVVVRQETPDYVPNLRKYKPAYMVHGTDWREGPLAAVRQKAIEVMAEWGGEVVEPEYTKDISSTKLITSIKHNGVMPNVRLSMLRRLLSAKVVRLMEAHSGLSAMVVDRAVYRGEDGIPKSYDGIWLSSLTDSTLKGKPDIEFVDLTSRIVTLNDILECSTKPIIYDGDTGGQTQHFPFTVRRLERLGVSAIIIEDKIGSKKNSLLDQHTAAHTQDTIEGFCEKIAAGKNAQITNDFMVIARIESLILEKGMEDALRRANAYIEAGADGIMIHSRQNNAKEIFEFCDRYNQFKKRRPLVVVPTNYAQTYETELAAAGANIIIYANQMLRASYTGMLNAANSILRYGRAAEADNQCIKALDLIRLIDGNV